MYSEGIFPRNVAAKRGGERKKSNLAVRRTIKLSRCKRVKGQERKKRVSASPPIVNFTLASLIWLRAHFCADFSKKKRKGDTKLEVRERGRVSLFH